MQRSISIIETAGYLKAGRVIFYDETARSGRGTTGALYLIPEIGGVARIPDRESVLSTADFRVEFNILSALHGIAEDIAVPPAALGETDDHRPALITPYYERTLWSRVRNLLTTAPADVERLVLDAALVFADVMNYLRYGSVYAAIEHKVRDFFMTRDERVVVTGWGNLQEQSPDICAAEVALFGELWFELLTGLPVPSRLNPVDDAQWQPLGLPPIDGGVVSAGMRVLIASAYHLPPARRFPASEDLPSYQPLAEALKKWKAVLTLQDPSPEDLTEALEQFYFTVPPGVLFPEMKALLRADTIWRLNRSPEAWAVRDNTLQALADLMARQVEDIPSQVAGRSVVEEGMATDYPVQPVPAKPVYDKHRARRRLVDMLPDSLVQAGASADAQDKISMALHEVIAGLEAPADMDSPEHLDALRTMLQDASTRLNNLKVKSARAMIDPLKWEIDLREKALDYRQQTFLVRQSRFRDLWQAGRLIPHLVTDDPAPEETTPLEDILGYPGMMAALDDLFGQPMVIEHAEDGTLLARLEDMQTAYRHALALANMHEREWLRDDFAPYMAYMRFVRQFYSAGHDDTAMPGSILRGAEAMLDNPYLQKPAIAMTIRRIAMRYLQMAYNRMIEACQTGIPGEVNIAAELWASIDSQSPVVRHILTEPENYAEDGHALTLANTRPGGAWALLKLQGEQCRDMDALYDDWLKLVGQDSVYRMLQTYPEQDRLTALLALFDRMKLTPGVNMSEILGRDAGVTVEEFRQMIVQAMQDAKANVDSAGEMLAQARRRADEIEQGVEMRIQRRIDEIRTQNWFKDAIDDQISSEFRQINDMAARLEALNTYVEDRTQTVEQEITGRISHIEVMIRQLDALTDDVQHLRQQQESTLSRVTDIQSHVTRLTRLESTLDTKLTTLRRQLFTGFLDWMEKNSTFASANQYIDALNRMREEMERCPKELFAPEHGRWERLYRKLSEHLVSLARESGAQEEWQKDVESRTQMILNTAKQKASATT